MDEIKYTVKNIDELKEAQDLIRELPDQTISLIESASFVGSRLECYFKQGAINFEPTTQTIYLPNQVTQITAFDDYIGIYCGHIFFKTIGKPDSFNFIFID